jgi:hypothetical protein
MWTLIMREQFAKQSEPHRRWYLLVWILAVIYNLSLPLLATIVSVIAVRFFHSGDVLNLVVYPQDIESGLLRISDAIGVWAALVMGVLFVVLFRLLSEWRPGEKKLHRLLTTLLVFIPIWGLFPLRKIGLRQGKIQFSLGSLLGTVTACMIVLSAATTIIQCSGLRGVIHVVLLLEMLFFIIGAMCFLLLLWRDRRRKDRGNPDDSELFLPKEGED